MERMKGRTSVTVMKLAGTAFVLLAGCSLLLVSSFGSVLALEKTFSGFLSDYSQLKPSGRLGLGGGLVYENPSISFKEYNKFIVDPIVVPFRPDARNTAIDLTRLKELTDFAWQDLVTTLVEYYQVVSAPGQGVLHIRAAITDVEITRPLVNLPHPSRQLNFGVGGITIEAEAVDSQTGERVLAVVFSRKASRFSHGAEIDGLDYAKRVVREWVDQFVERFDKAHGYARVSPYEVRVRNARYSGFLKDYSQLRPSREHEGVQSYQNPSKSLQGYDKFMLDPVIVHFAPNANGSGVGPTKLKKLTDYFLYEAINALVKRYRMVSEPGPGVLRLRMAITDVQTTQPMFNIHPATKLLGLGMGGASIEAEALDSITGERIFAVVDKRSGKPNLLPSADEFDELGHAKEAIKHWVERFVSRVDKAHGYKK